MTLEGKPKRMGGRSLFRLLGLVLAGAVGVTACTKPMPLSSRGSVATAASADSVITVNTAQRYQRLEGFGAATAYYQNWIVSHPNKTAIYDALFKGLKLDILRLQNVYRLEKGAGFARDDLDIVRAAEASLGRPVRILMSSWSPPAKLKSGKSEKNGGTLAQDAKGAFVYEGFGQYWYDALNAYRRVGIVPAYISIQNEPDWKAEWESCRFEPTERVVNGARYAGYDRAFDAVYRKVSKLPTPPKLLGPEPLGIGDRRVQQYFDPQRDKVRLAHVYGIAHHLYYGGTHTAPDTFLPSLHQLRDDFADKPRFQTEFGRSDGFQTAWLIHNCLVEEEASAYVYWAGVWPGDDCLITIDNPWERGKWKQPDGFRLNDRYFALKHYSYLTGPGYRRVAATGPSGVKTSAFLSPKGDWLVVVALNTSDTEKKILAVDCKGFTHGKVSEAYRTVFSASSVAEGTKPFQELGALGADRRITLPPRSIVTVAMQGRDEVALQ